MNRLNVIKSSNYFLTCKSCDLTYLPMSQHTKTNCPKCNPEIKIIDDETYLRNELKIVEEVSQDCLYNGNIKYAELGL